MNTSGNGLSEENAFKTIQEGVNIAKSGDKVWIKAGYYGAENVQTINAGNSSNPIIFEGYRLSPGDIKETYYNPYSNENDITSESLRSSEMPLLDGGDRLSGFGFNIHSSDNYLIIKNIQITNYYYGIGGTGMGINHINLINIICKDLGSGSVSDSGEAFMFVGSGSNDFNRFINCVAINGAHRNFTFKGEFNLTDNCKSYSDENGYDVVSLETDYYYYILNFFG